MNKAGKLVLRSSILVLLLLPLIAVGHYFAFPEETHCILVDYSDLSKEGNLYFRNNVSVATLDSVKSIINEARARDRNFLGGLTCQPKFIFCNNDMDYAQYGDPMGSPACTHTKLGSYIVLSRKGMNVAVIAHELMHAELYQQIGFFNKQFKIPVWYKEGLAMQVDDRPDFSEDSLRVYSNNFTSLPDLRKLNTESLFLSGTSSQVVLNYATARYEVSRWYTKEKMQQFIAAINKGAAFDKAYK